MDWNLADGVRPPPQMLQHIAKRPSNFRLGDLSWVLSKAQRFVIFILIDNYHCYDYLYGLTVRDRFDFVFRLTSLPVVE